MSDAIRVLLWSPWGAGEHYSGPGMSAFRLYSAAAPGQFELSLAHGIADHDRYDLYNEQVFLAPIAPHPLNQLRFLRTARRWLTDNHQRFDVMHALWGYEATVGPASYAEKCGLPAAVKIAAHRADLADKTSWRSWLGLTRKRRERLKRVSAVIAISRAIEDELLEYGIAPERIVRIPNGVDAERFAPVETDHQRRAAREQLGVPDVPTLIFVGSVEPRKRPRLVVQALAELRRRGEECQLMIVGPSRNPQYDQELRSEIKAHQLEPFVHLAGMHRDVRPYLQASDIFVLPSANEGMPNAMLEAMSCGLPSIVTRISGTTDLIENDVHGTFVNPEPVDLVAALTRYLHDPQLGARHGRAARDRVLHEFSAHVVLQQHRTLFEKLMQHR